MFASLEPVIDTDTHPSAGELGDMERGNVALLRERLQEDAVRMDGDPAERKERRLVLGRIANPLTPSGAFPDLDREQRAPLQRIAERDRLLRKRDELVKRDSVRVERQRIDW